MGFLRASLACEFAIGCLLQLVWESREEMRAEVEDESAESIMPRVREDAGSQTATQMREDAEERTVKHDEQSAADTFIEMRGSEEDGGDRDAEDGATGERSELLLQIAAKDELFADAGADAEGSPERELCR
jgi:hypothetical protein